MLRWGYLSTMFALHPSLHRFRSLASARWRCSVVVAFKIAFERHLAGARSQGTAPAFFYPLMERATARRGVRAAASQPLYNSSANASQPAFSAEPVDD